MTKSLTRGIRVIFWMVCLVVLGCSAPTFDRELTLTSVTIHIVGRSDQIPGSSGTIFGMCRWREMWVIGRINQDGELVINETMIGHELLHALSFEYPGAIASPHRRKQ